jgi:hypothetical protein
VNLTDLLMAETLDSNLLLTPRHRVVAGYRQMDIGWLGFIASVGSLICGPIYGWLLDKHGSLTAVSLAAAACSIGCLVRGMAIDVNGLCEYGVPLQSTPLHRSSHRSSTVIKTLRCGLLYTGDWCRESLDDRVIARCSTYRTVAAGQRNLRISVPGTVCACVRVC